MISDVKNRNTLADAATGADPDNPPADENANPKGQERAGGGKTNSEKRFEIGFFFRVHTETSTPPDTDGKPIG
jgi:hypothetical protein